MSDFAGHLSLRAAVGSRGRTVLAAQSFRAPFHLSKPYWDPDAGTLLVQIVNPTAGILAGDTLDSEILVQAGAAVLVTTPSASRIFRMRSGAATCRQRFTVDSGGWLEVLPEPLVPHQGSVYHQVTQVEIAPDGGLFFVDQLMPGRLGHGEAWAWTRLGLDLTVRSAEKLILRERFDPSGAHLQALARLAGAGDTACFANAVLIAAETPDAKPAWTAEVATLQQDGLWVGVSALRERGWSIKLIAPDPMRLRHAVGALRPILARHFPRMGCDARKL